MTLDYAQGLMSRWVCDEHAEDRYSLVPKHSSLSYYMPLSPWRILYLLRNVLQSLLADCIGDTGSEFLCHFDVPDFETSGQRGRGNLRAMWEVRRRIGSHGDDCLPDCQVQQLPDKPLRHLRFHSIISITERNSQDLLIPCMRG